MRGLIDPLFRPERHRERRITAVGAPRTVTIPDIVGAYDSWVVRLYCFVRFRILRQRFLEEIGQYLPREGTILDVGCGFGLFSLFFAGASPTRRLVGVDLDTNRIAMAQRAASRLGLENTSYQQGDAAGLRIDRALDAAYMLDIVHHIPPADVPPLIQTLRGALRPGGTLIVKDISTRPAYKRYFTWALDKAMDHTAPVHYWEPPELRSLIEGYGFRVYTHEMVDYLPYPHILYVCRL